MHQVRNKVGQAIRAAFEACPDRRFTLLELIALSYPDQIGEPTPAQYNYVSRAAKRIADELGWQRKRLGSNRARRLENKRKTYFVRPAVDLALSIEGQARLAAQEI